MSTWGATTIKIFWRDYKPPYIPGGELQRINLLPDHNDPSAKAQAIQQEPTGRKTVEATLIFDTYAGYQSVEADKVAGTVRTLVSPGETGDDYAIESIDRPDYRQSNAIFARVVFVEATP